MAGALMLIGCAGFNPQSGMSYDEWKNSAGLSFRGVPELVGMKDNITVYKLPLPQNNNTFYWFKDGRLIQVTQGELPQIRLQIENINH
jgi:hypothetical protein